MTRGTVPPPAAATIGELAIEDLLAHLAGRRATGTLTASAPPCTRKLFLVDGRLGGVASTDPRELLGHFLVGWGLLDAEQLGEALRIQGRLGTPLGRIVERMGLVDPEALRRVLRAQAEETLLDLFLEPLDEKRFLANVLPGDRALALDLPLADLVLAGVRRRQRCAELLLVLGSFAAVPRRVAGAAEGALSIRDRRILAHVDGRSDIEGLALACHLVPFHVAELVARSVEAGILEIARHPGAPPPVAFATLLAAADAALAAGDSRGCWHALEGLRREPGDEARTGAARVERRLAETLAWQGRGETLVPRLAGSPGSGAVADLLPAEAFVLSRVNQRWTLREIQRITPIEELHFRVIVATLERLGLIALDRVGTAA